MHSKKLSAKDRAAIKAANPVQLLAAEEKAKQLLSSGKISIHCHEMQFEACPVCHKNRLPATFSHGIRKCRNCCHYEYEGEPAQNATSLADSQAWWQAHRVVA
jgi:hypothetical protein